MVVSLSKWAEAIHKITMVSVNAEMNLYNHCPKLCGLADGALAAVTQNAGTQRFADRPNNRVLQHEVHCRKQQH